MSVNSNVTVPTGWIVTPELLRPAVGMPIRMNVHVVLTTSSKTVGARSMRRAARAPAELSVGPDECVEAGQILVEAEHARDSLRERVTCALADASGEGLDAKLAAALRQSHPACSARDRQRRRAGELRLESVRRQLGDAVRDDRARKVDRLPAATGQRQLRDEGQNRASNSVRGSSSSE